MRTPKPPHFLVLLKYLTLFSFVFLMFPFSNLQVNAQSQISQLQASLVNTQKHGPTHIYYITKPIGKSNIPKIKRLGKPIIDTIPGVNQDSSFTVPGADGDRGITYQGGHVMHSLDVHLIFWEPEYLSGGGSTPATVQSTYNSTIESFFTDLEDSSGTGYLELLSQYSDTSQNVPSSLTYDITVDTGDPYPATNDCTYPSDSSPDLSSCMDDNDLANEAVGIASVNHFSTGLDDVSLVYTAENQGISLGSGANIAYALDSTPSENGFCGYHSAALDEDNNEYLYGPISYPIATGQTEPTGCETPTAPEVDSNIDYQDYSAISTSSHELAESATDPEVTNPFDDASDFIGWIDTNTSPHDEIGDLCRAVYPTASYDSGHANIEINGDYYELQSEWSNNSVTDAITGLPDLQGCTLSGSDIYDGTIFQSKRVVTGTYPSQTTEVSLVATDATTGDNIWSSDSVTGGFDISHGGSHALYVSNPVVDDTDGLLYVEVEDGYMAPQILKRYMLVQVL